MAACADVAAVAVASAACTDIRFRSHSQDNWGSNKSTCCTNLHIRPLQALLGEWLPAPGKRLRAGASAGFLAHRAWVPVCVESTSIPRYL